MIEKPWLSFYPSGVPEHLEYPHVSVHEMLRAAAADFPNRTAIVYYDGGSQQEISRTSYDSLNQQSNVLAGALISLGIRKGDRVVYLMENSPELIVSFYGVLKSGAVAVACNPRSTAAELTERLVDSGAVAIICDEELQKMVQEVSGGTQVEHIIVGGDSSAAMSLQQMTAGTNMGYRLPDIDSTQDLALLQYTGGTTGVSKAAMLTHRNLVVNTVITSQWLDYRYGQEICISALPLAFLGGISGTMTIPLSVGATLILFRRFNPLGTLRAIADYKATRFQGVPAIYIAILNLDERSQFDLSSLTHSRSGAAPLPPAVKEEFDNLVGHEVLMEGYGLTEVTPAIHTNPIQRAKKGSIGVPLPDVEIRLVDIHDRTRQVPPGEEGEVILRGPQVMKGYWNMPQETADAFRDGWFYTGDLARMDEDGYFYIVGRIKEMINVSGLKVWPREVEEVLCEHPLVNQAAVFGAPDAKRGERVEAVVVLEKGQDIGSHDQFQQDLRAFCQQRLVRYKVPSGFEISDGLPMNTAGKVLRWALGNR